MEDSHCKGTVNLAEVESVSLVPPAPGAPKKVDDKAFFEVRGAAGWATRRSEGEESRVSDAGVVKGPDRLPALMADGCGTGVGVTGGIVMFNC